MKILIVDDQMINRMLLKAMVEAKGAEAILAESGREALHILRSNPVNLVLMDIEMPEMSGVEVVQVIRKNTIIADTVPIIAVTAHTEQSEIDAFKAVGMQDCIEKPLSAARLEEVLREYKLV